MKKRKGLILALTLTLVAVAGIAAAVWGGTGTPGSEGDPVVTKSYVDSKTAYATLQLTPGQQLIGGEGAEIILRSGEATAIDNGQNGVSDLTGGADLRTGTKVEMNHLLLVPRNDGRGIAAVTEIYVMVRGTYSIK